MSNWVSLKDNPPKKSDVFIVGNKDTKGVWFATYVHLFKTWYEGSTDEKFDLFEITHYKNLPEMDA